jgi:hypothetical protein
MFITATGTAKRQVKAGRGRKSRVVGQRYRTAGRQAQGGQKQGKTGAGGKLLVRLMNKTNWQQTNREHSYKYTGDNGMMGDTWRGLETITKTGETDQGVTNAA